MPEMCRKTGARRPETPAGSALATNSTASAPACRSVIPPHHICRYAPPGADHNTLLGRPRPDRGATPTARRRPPAPGPRPAPSPAGMLDERGQLPAECCGVLLVQVDLIRRATD